MVKQNQGYRRDLNLDETTIDTQALNNLAGAGIAADLRIIQNNLRNTSTLAYNSISNGFFTFPESVEAIFTNDDVVSVGTTVSIGSTTLQPSIDYYICNSNGETQFKLSTTSSSSAVGVSTISISGTPSPVAFDIVRKKSKKLRLGNLDTWRDWGWAPEYVEAMYLIMQSQEPEDYIIATGDTNSLKDFVLIAFKKFNLDASKYVICDESLFRPSDIKYSYLDPSKIYKHLSWKSQKNLENIIDSMFEDFIN